MTMRWCRRKKNRDNSASKGSFLIGKRRLTAVFLSAVFVLCTLVPAETIRTYEYDFYGLRLRIPERMEEYCFEVYVDLTTLMKDRGYVLWGTRTGETKEEEDGFREQYYTAAEYWSGDHRVRGILQNDATRDVAENDYSGGWSVTLQTVWRTVVFSAENTDPEADERFRCGPVPQMMDDSSKRLLLFEGLQLAPLERPELFGYASMDELRTPEGEVLYLFEYSQDWMKQDYDRQMEEYIEEYPNMKEYAESQIAKAREARETLNSEGISCMLSYRVVEYIEGMDDTELYAGGTEGQVTFAIRTGK